MARKAGEDRAHPELRRPPEDFTRERPTHEIACYPPEADFVVQSPSAPERTVCDPVLFDQIRQRYEHTRPQGPQRGWSNYAERNA